MGSHPNATLKIHLSCKDNGTYQNCIRLFRPDWKGREMISDDYSIYENASFKINGLDLEVISPCCEDDFFNENGVSSPPNTLILSVYIVYGGENVPADDVIEKIREFKGAGLWIKEKYGFEEMAVVIGTDYF